MDNFKKAYLFWMIIRLINCNDQNVPSFNGWQLNNRKRKNPHIEKTVVTYLPPIPTKVTDFQTIYRYLTYLQDISATTNMPYVNITLDIGAAMNCFKLIWNYQNYFNNIVIHPGDFHFSKENFLIIGSIIQGSGFEDLAFQPGICTSGSMKSVLSGSHYNRAWTVHSIFLEALEKLLDTTILVIKDGLNATSISRTFCSPRKQF